MLLPAPGGPVTPMMWASGSKLGKAIEQVGCGSVDDFGDQPTEREPIAGEARLDEVGSHGEEA